MTRSAIRARDQGAMGDPHLIGPVPRTTAAKTSGGRRPRALPDDLLRDASRRLGIVSLVAAGLWVLGTVLGHLAVRSMSHGDPQWLRVGAPEAIAARERRALARAVLLHQRAASAIRGRCWISGWSTWC